MGSQQGRVTRHDVTLSNFAGGLQGPATSQAIAIVDAMA
jgi:hypothetical protein